MEKSKAQIMLENKIRKIVKEELLREEDSGVWTYKSAENPTMFDVLENVLVNYDVEPRSKRFEIIKKFKEIIRKEGIR